FRSTPWAYPDCRHRLCSPGYSVDYCSARDYLLVGSVLLAEHFALVNAAFAELRKTKASMESRSRAWMPWNHTEISWAHSLQSAPSMATKFPSRRSACF